MNLVLQIPRVDMTAPTHGCSNMAASGTDVNAADREKRAALHWASGKNAVPCVEALIKAGADVNALDWAQHSPLHWACPMDAVESAGDHT